MRTCSTSTEVNYQNINHLIGFEKVVTVLKNLGDDVEAVDAAEIKEIRLC